MSIPYDIYNREERAICSHLFRLLHENLDKKWNSPLGLFIKAIFDKNPNDHTLKQLITSNRFDNIGIFTEVAIIRDAYFYSKPDVNLFMDNLIKLIMDQEQITDCRLYSELDDPLNNPHKTHPKQIRQKADSIDYFVNANEKRIYGILQGMFNAKPDLVITINNFLLTFEAKFTMGFDDRQLDRTLKITKIWAELFYKDFGFIEPPNYFVFILGDEKDSPHISWQEIFDIAKLTYNGNDRTYIALNSGIRLLSERY